jgi:hypothetical protein
MVDLFTEGNSPNRPRQVELNIIRELTYLNNILQDISPANASNTRNECLPGHSHKRILCNDLLY